MRKEIAKDIYDALLGCSGKLDRSVALLEGSVEEEFFNSHRRRVGSILGTFYIEILRDIFDQHPELEPESMK